MKTASFTFPAFIVFLFCGFSLISCDNDETIITDSSIIGKWQVIESQMYGSDEVYKPKNGTVVEYKLNGKTVTYYEDGKYESKYYTEDNMLYVGGDEKYSSYEYLIEGNKMTLTFKGHPDAWCITGMTKYAIYKRIE